MSRSRLNGMRRRVISIDRRQLAWINPRNSGDELGSSPYRHGLELAAGEAVKQARAALPAGATVEIIAANDLAVHWVQTPPAALASLKELRQISQARCAHLYGGSSEDWRVAGDWHSRHPFVCAALPMPVVTALEREFAQHKLLPRWHTAWGLASAGLARLFPASGWSAMRTSEHMVLWHCRDSRVDCLASLATASSDGPAQMAAKAKQRIQIENSRAEIATDDAVHWLDLSPGLAAAADACLGVHLHPSPAPVASGAESEAAAVLALWPLLEGRRV